MTSSATHPHGIKVLLENGIVGRVKEILETSTDRTYQGPSNHGVKLPRNEDQNNEFKSTFKFDLKRFQSTGERATSKEVEKSVSKTIAAFMNSQGGTLYIGINDEGKVVGLTEDYTILGMSNSDKFRLILKNSLDSYLKNKIIFEHIKFDFPLIDGSEICTIETTSSDVPIFLHDGGKQECYVRVDNESKPYDYKEFLEYWQRRSPKK